VCALTKVITGVFRLGEEAVQDVVAVVPSLVHSFSDNSFFSTIFKHF